MKHILLLLIVSSFSQFSFAQIQKATLECESVQKDVHLTIAFLPSDKANLQIQKPVQIKRNCDVSRYVGQNSALALTCGESSMGLPELVLFDAQTLKARIEFEKVETELNCHR
jgi:hypothetical protein